MQHGCLGTRGHGKRTEPHRSIQISNIIYMDTLHNLDYRAHAVIGNGELFPQFVKMSLVSNHLTEEMSIFA